MNPPSLSGARRADLSAQVVVEEVKGTGGVVNIALRGSAPECTEGFCASTKDNRLSPFTDLL